MAGLSRQQVERELEYRKCADSFPYFFQNYWKVLDKGAVKLPEVRPEQLEAAEVFQTTKRTIVLKARQIGWSTLVTAYTFWKAWFREQQHCLVLSRREDPEARLLLRMIRLGYDNLPLWMRRRGAAIVNRNLTKIEFAHGSYIDSDASLQDPARGRTLALLVMDEFGKFPNPEAAWGSALPATEHGQCIAIGNPNGYGTEFWRHYTQAKRGLTDFRALFYPWWVVPGRDREWYERETSSMTPAQRAAEFCEDDETCWNKAGSPVFDVERVQQFTIRDAPVGILGLSGFRKDRDGMLTVWKEPDIRLTYVIGADVADGLEHGDYSAASVLCANTGEHVAQFTARVDPHTFGQFLFDLGKYYGWALLGPERNRNGGALISHLRQVLRYPRVYRERTLVGTRTKVQYSDKFGWHTTHESKSVLVNDMWRQLLDGSVVSWCQELYAQMAAFRYRPDGTMTGSPHDDVLMGFGIAVQMFKAVSVPSTPTEREDEKIDWSKPQFAFGTTFGEYEEWTQQQESSRSPRIARMTPRAVRFPAARSGSASYEAESASDTPGSSRLGARPGVVVLNSMRTGTRGRTTSGARRSWLSDA